MSVSGPSTLRTGLLNSLRELMTAKGWTGVTMTEVARAAGVSRQTLYNEFGTRNGLAQAYAQRLAEDMSVHVRDALSAHVGNIGGALYSGFSDFFARASTDPMIQSLQNGEAKPELLRLITTDAGPLITAAGAALTEVLSTSWLQLPEARATLLARALTRMALSYVGMPPEGDRDVPADMADIFGPAFLAACDSGDTRTPA